MSVHEQYHEALLKLLRLVLKSEGVRRSKEFMAPYIAVVDKYEASGSSGFTFDEIERFNTLLERLRVV